MGSPEPPLPYRWQRIHEELEFKGAISIHRIPETSSYLVLEHNGLVYRFNDADQPAKKELVVDFNLQLPKSIKAIKEKSVKQEGFVSLFSCVFDPEYTKNHFVYFCMVWNGQPKSTTHISRFTLDPSSSNSISSDDELNILTCDGGGHNGCTLLFGPDQLFYISLGDLGDANPPDGRNTGQDISDLYGAILRIDVRNSTASQPYRVPDDNPFLKFPGAAPEVYAYGLRNPFRMAFDPDEGTLWVADVGWESWELIYRIQPGGNYGWSVKEGSGKAKDGPIGPTPIHPPDLQLSHSIAASITGGVFYRGSMLPELDGAYVCGDWVTRKFWSIQPDRDKPLALVEAAEGEVKPICFENDHNGELLVLDFNEAHLPSGLYRLVRNEPTNHHRAAFPTKLSQSGLFTDIQSGELAAGVHRYQVNESMWRDETEVDFIVSLPKDSSVEMFQDAVPMFNWYMTTARFPVGSVLAKTYSVSFSHENGLQRRRIETQVAVKDQKNDWQYYTYRWNESNTDADLVGKAGQVSEVQLPDAKDPSATRTVQWTFAARTQCKVCHSPWTGEAIGFIEPQLRKPEQPTDAWRDLIQRQVIVVGQGRSPLPEGKYHGIVSSHDHRAAISDRARSYLHANCSHCHIRGGNASTSFDLRFDKTLVQTECIDVNPMRGNMGLEGAKIVAAGSPATSVLLIRMAKLGMGHMPQIGNEGIDHGGVRLIGSWIASLDTSVQDREDLDCLNAVSASGITDDERMEAAGRLMATSSGAVKLSMALSNQAMVPWIREQIIERSLTDAGPMREVLEPFAPKSLQQVRLGSDFEPDDVLRHQGNADRGKILFQSGAGSCSSCHVLDDVGKAIGPNLARLSNPEWDRSMLLTQIVSPSERIHPDYKMHVVLTDDGTILQGQLIEQREDSIDLVDANGNRQTVMRADIEEQRTANVSMMPENLLGSMTGTQAADLLEYLRSLQASKN